MLSDKTSMNIGTSEERLGEPSIGGKRSHIPRDSLDPLEILPEEIWTAIVAESATGTIKRQRDAGDVISQDILLDFMQVSLSWRVKISSNAVLWVDIILEDEYDAAAKASLALHYSNEAPVALYMFSPTGWWDVLKELLVANRERVNKIFFDSPSSFIVPILEGLSPLLNLKAVAGTHLYIQQDFDNIGCLIDCPLEWVYGLLLGQKILRQLDTRRLRKIGLWGQLEEMFDCLRESEYLQEVHAHSTEQSPEKSMTEFKKHAYGPPLPWIFLSYKQHQISFFVAIIHRLSNLKTLDVHVSEKELRLLLPLLFQLPVLSTFYINGFPEWSQADRMVIPAPSTSVKTTYLILGRVAKQAGESLILGLLQSVPHIKHLVLWYADIAMLRMCMSSNGFQGLETLSFVMAGNEPVEGTMEPFAPSVHRVSLAAPLEHIPSLTPLHSPGVKHLYLGEYWMGKPSTNDLYSDRWPALCSFSTDCVSSIGWKGPPYRHLVSMDLKGGLGIECVRNMTRVCCDIALDPASFPALSELKLGICPEWDILLILLEGRNVVTQPAISPISILQISLRCPPLLVELLREVIKGNRVTAPSYYDLSIAGNKKIFLDRSIPGCNDCHRALRFCTLEVDLGFPPVPELHMDYPERTLDILESWESRAENWYSIEDALRSRRCLREFPLVSLFR